MFTGLSTLREAEKAKQPPPEVSEKAKSLQAYLASKYTDGGEGAKKKKKKKKPKIADAAVIRIVDEDVSGFVAPATDAVEEEQDEGPLIANPEEAERALRFKDQEQLALQAWETVGASRQRHDSSPDLSPPRRARHDSSPDLSPPRKNARHGSSPDLSPPRRARHDSSPDLSPPRRARHDSGPGLSPPRRARHYSSPDLSPPRKSARHSTPPDLSPPLKPSARGKQPTMADGRRGGIVKADELMEEVKQKRAEEAARFAALGDDVTGRGATTVYRDAEGRVVDAETAAASSRRGKVKKKAEYEGEKDLAWGGGLAQKRAREEAAARMRAEAAKPFARTRYGGVDTQQMTVAHQPQATPTTNRDDAELNDAQRTRSRWGDPLAGLRKPTAAAPLDDAPVLLPKKHAKKARFIVPQEVPPHSWMRRNLPAAPNRYNIKPGRHWDGVDRSNGFERDMFKIQNERQARQAEDYAMSAMDIHKFSNDHGYAVFTARNPSHKPAAAPRGFHGHSSTNKCVNPPPVRCNFQDSPPARKSAHKRRRRGGAHTNRKRKTSMSRVVTKATNRHHQPRNRAPPPPPRNTNKYLMAAAAARSKAEGIDDEVWDMEPSVLSPGRSSASTCFGGGTNEEEH